MFDEYRGIVSKAVLVIVVKRPCWREHSRQHPNQIVEPASSQSLPAQSIASGQNAGVVWTITVLKI